MWNGQPEPETDVGLKAPQKIFAAVSGKPAIDHIGQHIIEPVRNAKGIDRITHTFVPVNQRARPTSSYRNRVSSVEVEFHVKILGAKSQMRSFTGEPEEPHTVIG